MDWPQEKARIADDMRACKTVQQLHAVWVAEWPAIRVLQARDAALGVQIVNLKDYLKPRLINDPARQAP